MERALVLSSCLSTFTHSSGSPKMIRSVHSCMIGNWQPRCRSKAVTRWLPQYAKFVEDTDAIWQARYYPFNVYSEEKLLEKLNYMHQNPVRRGLVENAVDWLWSSCRWYELRKPVGLSIGWIEP